MSLASEDGHLPGAERGITSTTNPLLPVNVFYIRLLPKSNSPLLFTKVGAEFISLYTLKAFYPVGQCKTGAVFLLKDKPSWADFVLCTFCTCTIQLLVIVHLHRPSASSCRGPGGHLCPCHSKPMGRMQPSIRQFEEDFLFI